MIEIRPLRINDSFEDLIALSRAFFKEYEEHHKDFFKIDKLRDEDIVDYFSRWLTNDNGETFIAIDGDRIIGYITAYVKSQAGYWKIKKIGAISGFMVHEDYRRKGIARRLLAEAGSFFGKKGVKYFTAFTSVANRDAIKFYEECGMVPLYTTMLGGVDNDTK